MDQGRELCNGFRVGFFCILTSMGIDNDWHTFGSFLKKKMIARFDAPFEKKDWNIGFRITRSTMSAVSKLPLYGVKVLDLTRVLAGRRHVLFRSFPWDVFRIFQGPFASMTLADFGADVIKVEKPGRRTLEDSRRNEMIICRSRRWYTYMGTTVYWRSECLFHEYQSK